MNVHKQITKVGLAAVECGRLLVVRKRGAPSFILPGGKPELGEDLLDTLLRELSEELGCGVIQPAYEGSFADRAADLPNTDVVVLLYSGTLAGKPEPRAEIEEFAWVDLAAPGDMQLAPSITNHILPYLRQRAPHLGFSETGAVRPNCVDRA
ncbi:NUDIX domain-containing protein [Sphingomonas parva]|uniref:NUDIX domain-containing protein n=1 Tax=Sphingomonas parva TaxID=2555898 RepID=A0A4Y8ZTJ5_9SPHN|nr:NUDIX domain-containing protein [Sphingomonas parva]TFI58622.1 NUDIX domain-containing protein [Sphingomonas parva]